MSIILREKLLKNKGKSLYLDIYHNGKRSYDFLGIIINKDDKPDKKKEKLDIANGIRSLKEIELLSKGTIHTPKHKKNVDFLKFYDIYLEEYKKKDVRMIRYSLEKFKAFLKKEEFISDANQTFIAADVGSKICEDYMEYLKSPDAGLKGETPHNYFSRFRKVLKAAAKVGLFKESPASGLVFKKSDDSQTLKKQVLFIDELRTLVKTDCGNDEVKRAFLFACQTGLGLAEIKKLKWANIDNLRLITTREKTSKKVNIKLSDNAIKLLGKRGKSDDFIFNIDISDTAINKDLKTWVERAEIDKKITFYCGRHTYAVMLLMNGANLKTVAEAMGQTNTQSTVKYLNYVDSLKDKATSELPDMF
jgi:site-specific recombinase XerD